MNTSSIDIGSGHTFYKGTWNFGDGSEVIQTSGIESVKHAYLISGEYEVCYTIESRKGTEICEDQYCITLFVVAAANLCCERNQKVKKQPVFPNDTGKRINIKFKIEHIPILLHGKFTAKTIYEERKNNRWVRRRCDEVTAATFRLGPNQFMNYIYGEMSGTGMDCSVQIPMGETFDADNRKAKVVVNLGRALWARLEGVHSSHSGKEGSAVSGNEFLKLSNCD